MNILFRVDAGGIVGLGHYYRSINLAKKLMARGHEVFFVHKESSFWSDIECHFIHFDIDTEEDQIKLIEQLAIDLFYVDGILNFTEAFIHKVNDDYDCRIIFYQNISSARFLCDTFILPSIHQQSGFFENFRKSTKIYQGLEYFTFNEKVESISPKSGISENIYNVAIVSGGSDPKNMLVKLYQMFKEWYQGEINFNYFYGNNYLFKSSLPSNAENHNFHPFDLNEIMKNDMAITSFGVSAYEFMALKMPVIGIGHQTSNAEACNYLARKGLLFSLGNIDNLSREFFLKEFDKIVNNVKLRRQVIKKSSLKIDLQGINRVIKIIENEQ